MREALTSDRLAALPPSEAAATFVARRAEGLTAQEEALLDDWLAEDVAHQEAFASAERAWGAFGAADNHELLDAMRAHALAAPRPIWVSWRLAAGAAAAAAAAVLLTVGFGCNRTPPEPHPRPPGEATVEYVSARGQVRDIKLPDGSAMTLDADSVAVAGFEGSARTVALKRGRAYFAVVHIPDRPFTVVAGGQRIADLGTRFEVNIAGSSLTVAVYEGRVGIGAAGTALVPLGPGQVYVARDGTRAVAEPGGVASEDPSWRSGVLRFDDLPIGEAADMMNRYSRERIVIRGSRASALRVSGQFHAGDAGRFAETLTELHGLRSSRHGDTIELTEKK